jgi:hypothetical protein
MNNTLGDRVDAKPEQTKTGHDWYDNAPTMSMNNMPSYKHAFKFGMSVLQSMDAETKQHFAEADNDKLFSYLMKLARKKGFDPKYFVEEDMWEVTGLFSEIFHDPSMQEWEWADLLRSTLNNQDITESMAGKVVFSGTGDDGSTYEIIQSGDGFMIHANGRHIDTYGSLQRAMSVLKNEVPGLQPGMAEMDNRTPSGDREEQRKNSPEQLATQHKEQQQRLKDTSPKMRKKLGLPEPKQGMAEGAPVTTTPGSINPGGAVDNFKQQMANNTEVAYQAKLSGVGEGEQQKGADYRDPPEADYGDDYQDMVARMKKLAGLGPLKTVYDPAKRVYRNVPTAVQPKK